MSKNATTQARTVTREFYTPAMAKRSAEVGPIERFVQRMDKTAQLY